VDDGVDGDTHPECGGSVPPSGHLVGIHQPPFHVKNTRDPKHNLICGLSDVINPVVMLCGTTFHIMANMIGSVFGFGFNRGRKIIYNQTANSLKF
jgi:hypothetical protein